MRRKNIVVIEDDEAILEIISHILLAEGYEVSPASRWEPATAVADHQPGLVLIDEWLKGEPGSLLCHEIKSIHQLAHVPVIILSTSFEIEAIALSCKADGYIRKPFDVEELLSEIRRCAALPKPAAAG